MAIKRPPGPKGHFITGSISDFAADQLGFLSSLAKEYGSMAYMRLGHLNTYLLSDSDLIREVLVTKSKSFEKAKLDKQILGKFLGNGLLTSDGSFHRKQRRLAQPAFHAKRIQNYAEVMTDYTTSLMADWQDGQSLDIADRMIYLTMLIVSKTLFDADAVTGDDETAVSISNAIHDLQYVSNQDYGRGVSLPNWVPTKDNRTRNRAIADFTVAMEKIIDERRATAVNGKIQDSGDLLSMLMLSEDEDGNVMNDRQLRDEVATLFAAGHETTSNALSWTWYLLSLHPEVEQKLHEEVDRVLEGRVPTLADLPNLTYTTQVIKESMRVYPPVWILNGRSALEDVELGGYTIPKGSIIFISPYVMHHLESQFENAEQFIPERFTPEFEKELPKFAYMPFGGGPRVCIGNSFAMMEAQLILATIAQKFRFELEPNQEIVPLSQITLTPEDGIQMRVVERETAVYSQPPAFQAEPA